MYNLDNLAESPQARIRLATTTSLGGLVALMMLAMPGTAVAANECGVAPLTPGTVTCTLAGNPYNDGITYIAPPEDLTIVLKDGVRVNTGGTFNIGVLAVGDNAFTVNGGTNTIITTDSDGGFGALVSNNVDPLSVTLDRVVTTGTNAIGVIASSSEGAITVATNSVSTTGARANGISATTDVSAITIRSGMIMTTGAGAAGIDANSDFGDLNITSATVATGGNGTDAFNLGATGILAQTGGIGTVTVNSGAVTTSGSFSDGIRAVNGTGALSVTSGTIGTTGLNSSGINVASRGGTATVNSGSITTTGANANGIVATGTTGANVTFTTISTTGANANGVLVPAGVMFFGPQASAVTSVNGGSVTTTGATSDGVRAVAATGTSTVNITGNVSTQGVNSRGIFANGVGGVSVINSGTVSTTGATSNGVDAFSLTGPATVAVTNVSTTGNGSNAVVVNAVAGNATASVTGALRTTGTTANALTVNSGANAIVNVGAGGSFATTQGDFVAITSAGTSTLTNLGTIGNNANGVAVIATGGPITINNSGNLTSDIVLTGGADRINNSGTFTVGTNPDFGAGVDVFNNTGLILVGSDATAVVTPIFTGLETTTNSGTIDLRNGRTGDTLTLPGTYTGANGTLGLDVMLGNTSTSDQLVVSGLATGTTVVALNQLSGSQPVFTPGTILVRASTGSAADAFDLAGGALDAGFVRYEIQYNAANGDFFLTGAPSDTAFRTLNYAESIRSLWLKSADVVSAQLRGRRDALWTQGGGDVAGRMWVQIHGSTETRKGQRNFNAFGQSRNTNTGYQQDYFGGQIGFDVSGGSGDRGGFAFGVTGGYINSTLNFAGVTDRVTFDAINGGAYASYTSGNFFANALGKYDYYWADTSAPSASFQQEFKGSAYGARGEVGFRFGSDSFFIEPAASISYVKNDFDDLSPLGTTIGFDEDEGLRGRAGGRIGGAFDLYGSKVSVYAGGNYIHEFKGEDNVTFTSGGQAFTFTNNRLRDYGEAVVGITVAQTQGISGFIEGNYVRSFKSDNGFRGIEGAGGRAGVRIKF